MTKGITKMIPRRKWTAMLMVALCLAGLLVWKEWSLNSAQRRFVALLEQQAGNYNDNRVVLPSTNRAEAQAMAEVFGGTLRITKNGRFAVINLPEGMTLSDIAENDDYRKYHDRIGLDYNNFSTTDEDVADDTQIRSGYVVEDPMYAQQTYIDYLNIGGAWDLTRGADSDGEKVTVAIIDTGIDTDHPEFYDADGNSIISTQSYDATNDKVVDQYDISVIEDTNGHGTAVAGIIAAQMNEVGTAGIAPDVELLVIKCENDEAGEFKSSADIVFAIYYAIEMDADVINMSLGGSGGEDMKKALQLAVDSDIICVAAAGNETTDIPHYPAAYDTVIGVGALAEGSWEIAGYSNFGINSDIMAPGTALTTAVGGDYTYQNGTSISAPMVTAAVALYKSQNLYVTYDELKAELLAAGKDLGDPGEDQQYGFGALDINAFICEDKGTITYDYCTEEIKSTTQVFVRRHTIQTVPEPERENIAFDDWYYDKAYTRVFDYDAWYSTEFVEDVTLYAKWVNEDDEDASVYNYRTLADGTIEIVSYEGKRRYLVIPNEIDGKIVSSIGTGAFANNTRLREVTFPEGLVYIKTKAFSDVNKMRAITFTGDRLQQIQDAAFYRCASLRKLELPDSVTEIGKEAFYGCSAMTSVVITENSNLTAMGDFAFSGTVISSFYIPKHVTAEGFNGSVLSGCSAMRAISVHSGNAAFTVNGSTLYNAAKTAIVYYPTALTGSYTVADGVESIGKYAFHGSSVSRLELNSVVTIGDNAFASTKKLASVVLPDTVTTLGESAFQSSSISQVTLSQSLTTISDSAFRGSKLTAVQIPANVQTICDAAFMNCSYLRTLTFADHSSLQSIQGGERTGAFANCSILKNFELPEALTTIGERAFYSCRSITALTIPANVSAIGSSAFQYCSLLLQVDFADGCVLTSIPAYCFANCTTLHTVNFSDGIATLGNYAFSNDRLLQKLDFGENSGLITVGEYCFYSCSALQTMQLPESVTSIGQFSYAFSGLNQAEISANVSSIGNGAFGACYLLTEISVDEANTTYAAVDNVLFSKDITTVYCVPASHSGSYALPETVKVTAPYSFYYDKFLTAVILPQGLEDIQMNSFYNCSSLAGIEIPANVTNIGRKAFENCYSMESVTIGAGSCLQRLGIYTFVNCGFSEITIPASVEEIAQYVFYNCNDLRTITFEENSALTYIAGYLFKGTRVESVVFEEGSALTSLQAHAFDGASRLTHVDFGDAHITNIDNYAFYNCAMLEEIEIPDTVTYIGRYAFYGCAKLDRIDLPEAVDYIGESAFFGTNSILVFFAADTLPAHAQADWDKGVAGYFLGAVDYVVTDEWEYSVRSDGTIALSAYKGSASELTIDTVDGYMVSRIGARCFYNNDTLASLTLSENITEVGNYAFYDCDGLVAITVPASVEKIGKYAFADSAVNVTLADGSGLEVIDDYAFSGNVTVALNLPDAVTVIGDGAFQNSSLTGLAISQTSALESIGQQAFMGCGITDIYLPASLKTVGTEAFKDVTSLTDVEIAGGDTSLKLSNGAFEGCGISEITIPARVWYIGEYTLGNCQNLQNIHVDSGNTTYTSLDGVLCDINGTTLIQYPGGRSGAYEVPAQITVLTYASFRNAKGLTEVTFAEGSTVRTIGWQTFGGCESLTKITVPDTVVSFDFYAFENCTALTDVVLGEGTQLNGVYEGAFYGCTALQNIALPDSIVEISDYAFYNCAALTAIPLSENSQVKGIYDYAFYGCSGITEIHVLPQLVEIGEYAFAYTNITEYTVGTAVKDIAANAFTGCENFTTIYCDEANEEYVAIDGALYEKGADSIDDWDALIIWPYGNFYVLGQGKTVLTAADTAVVSQLPEMQFEIADTVTTIGEKAFYNRNNLVHLTIPEGVVSIGNSAFYGCTGLTILEIPKSITDIGENAFANCRAIIITKANDLPENVADNWTNTTVLLCQPKECGVTADGFGYWITEDSTAIVGAYKGTDKIVRVPDTVKNYPVVALVGTFYQNEAVTSVTIPDKVTEIPGMLFYGCKNLKSVQMGKNITAIGDYAFYNCLGLGKAEIPDTVTTIGAYAYYGCDFTEVTIPENVRSIGVYAFYICNQSKRGFDRINFNATAMDDSRSGNNIFGNRWGIDSNARITIGANVTRIPAYMFHPSGNYDTLAGEIIFEPGSVCQSIGRSAFQESNFSNILKEVILPEGLKTIDDYAFGGCADLEYVYIPGSVENVSEQAFSGCIELATAGPTGGGYNIEFGWTEEIPAYAFSRNASLKRVELPESITAIGEYAFYFCGLLDEITMPAGISDIGNYAFYYCNSLHEVQLPGNMTRVGNYAFLGCEELAIIINGENLPATCGAQWSGDAAIILNPKRSGTTETGLKYYVMQDDTLMFGRYVGDSTNVVIPEQIEGIPVTEITGGAFSGNPGITSVSIPDTVTAIGFGAFRNCTALKEITIPENVVSIEEYAFAGCSALEKVNFNATAMDDLLNRNYVFYNAGAQTSGIVVTIGTNVTRVPAYLFQNAKVISVAAEEGCVCTSIGAAAFSSCSLLKEVSLPETVAQIGSHAFSNCGSLVKITIPTKNATFTGSAFAGCSQLKTAGPIGGGFDFEFGWVDSIPDYAFQGCSSLRSVFLPDSVTSIGYNAFYGCSLEEIPWPAGLTKISVNAFANNTSLTEVVISDSVTSLGSSAFSGCTNLSHVVIPAGAKPTGGSVFSGCTQLETAGPIGGGYDIEFGWTDVIPAYALSGTPRLKRVVVPDGITSIGGAAFSNCDRLSEISLPQGLVSIGYEAFLSCRSLPVIVLPASVTSIGSEAFSSCESLVIIFEASMLPDDLGDYWYRDANYILNPLEYGRTEDGEFFYYITQTREAGICSYFGTSETLEIPAQIAGYPITLLSGGVFSGKTGLVSVKLPDTITQIGDRCFYGCDGLTNIVLPDALTHIGQYAFTGCSSLRKVALPDGLTQIGRYAFEYCTSLERIEIPGGVTVLYGTFNGCTKLSEVILPEGLKELDTYTFLDCTSLANVILPESLEKLGYWAFRNCTSLQSIVIPENVREMAGGVFSDCTALKLVRIDSQVVVAMITSASSGGYLCNYADTVVIPAEITAIGSYITDSFTYVEELDCDGTHCAAYSNHAHAWTEGEVIAEYVECQQDGVIDSSCTACGLTGSITTPAHDYAQTETVEPTCTAEGSIIFTCTRCAHILTETLDKTGHSFGDWYTVEESSDSSAGISHRDCAICGYYESGDFTTTATGTCGDSTKWVFTGAGKLWIYGTGVMDSWTSYYNTPWTSYRSSVTSIQVDEGIIDIGNYAFRGMSKLTSVVLPESLTSIGNYAFYGCALLTQINILDAVTYIGEFAFYDCKKLAEITLPAGLTGIGRYAFYNCTELTGITIPSGVTAIGASAFRGCSSLTEMILPDNLSSIGQETFEGCTGLTEVILPEGLKTISAEAFMGCTGLTSITIPASVTSIGNNAFNCANLTAFRVDENNQHYASDESGVLFDKYKYQLIQAPCKITGDYSIPEGVVLINDNAFKDCTGLTSVNVPEGVTAIGDSVFYNCSSLTEMLLPEGLTAIGDNAFRGCTGLTSVNIPAGVPQIGECMFMYCSSLDSLVISEGVTSVGRYAFYGCSSLSGITLPEGVTNVGENAFARCGSLTRIVIPQSVTSIGISAFSGCASLTSVELPDGITSINIRLFEGCTSLVSVNIPTSATKLCQYAFYNCSSLTSVTIPANVTEIETQVFYNCSSLTGIWVDEANTAFSSDEKGVLYDKAKTTLIQAPGALSGDYVILESTTAIQNAAFNGCRNLKGITIPENVLSMGNTAFYNCTGLETINFNAVALNDIGGGSQFYMAGTGGSGITVNVGAKVTRVPAYLFYQTSSAYAPKVVKVVFAEGAACSSIGSYAFGRCTSMTSITLPDSVTSIENNAFYECTGLTNITIPDNVTSIGTYIFYNCTSLTNVTISDSVTSIGTYTFYNCTSLANITIPDNVTSIGARAFYNCTSLTSVTISDSVNSIGTYTFYNCTSLASITIPDSVTSIEGSAFARCSNLTDVYISRNVTTIQSSAFSRCYKLTNVTFSGDAPGISSDAFYFVTADVYYPSGNTTWTADVMQNYGGTLTWKPMCTEHKWDDWAVVTEVSCSQDGEKRRDCAVCDHYETEIIPATGHSYESVVTDPSCMEDGFTVHTCSACGDSYKDSYVDALGHTTGDTVVENTVEATCETDGSYDNVVYCIVCEEELSRETVTVPASGHNYGAWETTKAPGCTETGEKQRTCTACDHFESEILPAIGHSYETVVSDPTCVEEGFTVYTCSVCGDSYMSDYVSPKGHSYSSVITDPTCTEQGFTTHTCTVCGESYMDTYVDAPGHAMGDWYTVTAAACEEEGEEHRDCERCDHFESRTVSAVGHIWDEGVVTVEATEESEGEMLYTCTVCGKTRTEVIPTLEHVHGYEGVVTDPTCTEEGYTTFTCRCGDSYVGERVAALGHDLGQWTVLKDATCIENGEELRRCSRCENTETQVIPAIGHAYSSTVTDPTCSAQGYTTHTCENCGDSYADSYTDTLGHSFTQYISNGNATCTEEGTMTAVCDRCDATDTVLEEGSATGHDYMDGICAVCGEKEAVGGTCGTNAFWIFNVETGELTVYGNEVVAATSDATTGCVMDDYASAEDTPWNPYRDKIVSAVVEGTVSHIGDYAFSNLTNLTEAVIKDGVSNLGSNVFANSMALKHVAFEGDAPVIAEDTFASAEITVSYPAGNATWTEEIKQQYGGVVVWKENNEKPKDYFITYTSASISLAGDIGVNYYAQLSDDIVADEGAYMQFTVAGQTQIVPISEAVVSTDGNGVTTHRFSCKVAAKQMTEDITGQFYLSDGTPVGEAKEYSVKAYCDAAIPIYSQYEAYAELVELMEAMLNYGAYSQVQFSYNTGNLANASMDTTLPEITADNVSAYAHGATGSENGISVASVSLLLESTTTIRFYFNLDGSKSIDEYTFLVDGEEVTPVQSSENQYYVDKVNVAAKDLDEMVTVAIGGLTVKYCGLSYVRQVAVLYPTYYSEALVNVAKALYAYNQAANAYFA